MNMVSIYKTIIIAMVFLCTCFTAHANSQVCLEGKFHPDRALFIAWGDPTLSKKEVVWNFPAFVSNRPAKKEMLNSISASLFENINKRVVSLPDKLLNVPSDNSTLILLVCTRPFETDYGCNACVPLLGAQLWHKQGNSWCLLAEDRAITFMGGIGELTYENVEIVKVGPDRIGVLFEDEYGKGGESRIRSLLLIPNGDRFDVAFDETISESNVDIGYDESETYEYTAKTSFIKGTNSQFFDMKIVTSGTKLNKRQKKIPWNREMIYVMNKGHYVLKTDRPISVKGHLKK